MGYQSLSIHQIIPVKNYARAQSNLKFSWKLHMLQYPLARHLSHILILTWNLYDFCLSTDYQVIPASNMHFQHGFPAFTWHEHPHIWYQNLHQIYTSLTATGTWNKRPGLRRLIRTHVGTMSASHCHESRMKSVSESGLFHRHVYMHTWCFHVMQTRRLLSPM